MFLAHSELNMKFGMLQTTMSM